MNARHGVPWPALLVFPAVAWALYYPALHGPFVFDDRYLQEAAPVQITRLSQLGDTLAARGYPRKVTMATFALNHYFGGLDPYGYHVVNVLIHAGNGILVFLLASRLLMLLPPDDPWARKAPRIALAGALLWLVHPVQTQAVAYVSQRFTDLAAFFFLASLVAYVEGRLRAGRTRYGLFGLSAACGLLALGAKENTATLPLFVGLVELLFFQPPPLRVAGKTLARVALLLAAFAAVAWVFLGPRFLTLMQSDYARRGFTATERVLTQLRVVVYYVSLLAFPHPTRLHLDYDFPLSRSLFDPPTTAACALVLSALVAIAVRGINRTRLLSFAILWFLGNLAIESSVVPLDIVYEHRLYLPSVVPLVFLCGLLMTRVLTTPGREALLGVVLLLCAFWSAERSRVWADPIRLFADNAQKAPGKARVHMKLGKAYADAGDYTSAAAAFARALALDPDDVHAYNNLAATHIRLGQPAQARPLLEEALRRHPAEDMQAGLHANLGQVSLNLGDLEGAVRHFRIAIDASRGDPWLSHGLARAQIRLGDFAGAAATLQDAMARWPAVPELAQLLSALQEHQRRTR